MEELRFIVEPAPEGGHTARADGASIFTEGEAWVEAERMARDAVKCHFEEDGAAEGDPSEAHIRISCRCLKLPRGGYSC